MQKECDFFKYYYEPYGKNKDGKPKFHNYRKKEVINRVKKYSADVLRPIITWSATETLDYILASGQRPNPLYYQGSSRVGCYPCIMARHSEMKQILENTPEVYDKIEKLEKEAQSTFFRPDYLPKRYRRGAVDPKSGKRLSTISYVKKYMEDKDVKTLDLFHKEDDNNSKSCMSAYNICE